MELLLVLNQWLGGAVYGLTLGFKTSGQVMPCMDLPLVLKPVVR